MNSKLLAELLGMRVTVAVMFSVVFVLSGCDLTPAPGQSQSQAAPTLTPDQSSMVVPAENKQPTHTPLSTLLTPTSGQAVPSPVGTYLPIVNPTYPAYPSATPPPYTPEPIPTLPPPPPPRTAFATASPSSLVAGPNIAWGAETKDSLAIWVGVYSDGPNPSISDPRPVAQWDTQLKLLDIAASPDGQSLAVLSRDAVSPQPEGFPPAYLSVIDLNTNNVQAIPDYNYYDLYENSYYGPPQRILGWLDNNRLAVEPSGGGGAVVATKDGTTYTEVNFPARVSSIVHTALSPDGEMFFSNVVSDTYGYWLYATDGSNLSRVATNDPRDLYNPSWSPDSRYIGFLSPKLDPSTGVDDTHKGVWLLDLDTGLQRLLSGEDTWNVDLAWSLDSSQVAFLRSDGPITDPNVWYGSPEMVDTNLFVADITTGNLQRLTSFTKVKNSGLQWTTEGNVIFSSTVDSVNGLPGIVAVSPATSDIVTLASGSSQESLVHPLMLSR